MASRLRGRLHDPRRLARSALVKTRNQSHLLSTHRRSNRYAGSPGRSRFSSDQPCRAACLAQPARTCARSTQPIHLGRVSPNWHSLHAGTAFSRGLALLAGTNVRLSAGYACQQQHATAQFCDFLRTVHLRSGRLRCSLRARSASISNSELPRRISASCSSMVAIPAFRPGAVHSMKQCRLTARRALGYGSSILGQVV